MKKHCRAYKFKYCRATTVIQETRKYKTDLFHWYWHPDNILYEAQHSARQHEHPEQPLTAELVAVARRPVDAVRP